MNFFMMNLLNGLLGNASKVNADDITKQYSKIFAPGEKVEHVYKQIRDLIIFTDRRFIFVDIQGITGKKVSFHSIPYRNISHFCVETAGLVDLDAELKIWVVGNCTPVVELKFSADLDVNEIQRVLADYVLAI